MAVHDPGKVLLDLAISLAIGGDCLADIARLIAALAADAMTAFKTIDTARAATRARAWQLAGQASPNHDRSAKAPLVVDVDATWSPATPRSS